MASATARFACAHASGLPPKRGAKNAATPSSHWRARGALSFITPPSARKMIGRTATRDTRSSLSARHLAPGDPRGPSIPTAERLSARLAERDRVRDLRRFLTDEVWPQVSAEVLGEPLSRAAREEILGYGQRGL